MAAAALAALACCPLKAQKNMENVLNEKQQHIVAISCLEAKGDVEGLAGAISGGLDAGLTVSQVKEALSQLYAYTGFPRSLNALATLQSVLDGRKRRGIDDPEGRDADPLPEGYDALRQGTEVQTKLSGRPFDYTFAPATDYYLKAHLFGDIFGRDNIDWKTREIATIAMLSAVPGLDSQLAAHIGTGKHNGLTDAQVAEILSISANEVNGYANTSPFPFGEENTAFAKYFSGKSWRQPLISNKELNVPISNITFEPGCRNNWHSHTGGQILVVTGGEGYYQERGKAARRLVAGDVVEIPANVEHWHGAAPDSWFAHLSIECNPQTNKNTWLEPVSDADYRAATEQK